MPSPALEALLKKVEFFPTSTKVCEDFLKQQPSDYTESVYNSVHDMLGVIGQGLARMRRAKFNPDSCPPLMLQFYMNQGGKDMVEDIRNCLYQVLESKGYTVQMNMVGHDLYLKIDLGSEIRAIQAKNKKPKLPQFGSLE